MVKKVSMIDVLKRMADEDDEALMLFPLSNLVRAKKVRAGTDVTIGVGPEVSIFNIMNGKYIGSLFLIDKEKALEWQKKMEGEDGH